MRSSILNRGLVPKTVALLRVVASNSGIGLSSAARLAGMPKATALRILAALGEEGIVRQDEFKNYRIGIAILAICPAGIDRTQVQNAIVGELQHLVEKTEETVGLDVLVGDEVVVVAQMLGPQLISQALKPVPRSLPTWCTSTGKVLLANLSEAEIVSRHQQAVLKYAAQHAGESLLDHLRGVRQSGLGTARDELAEGASALAVPVYVDGRVDAAVWVGGPTDRMAQRGNDFYVNALNESATAISRLLSVMNGEAIDTEALTHD